MKQPCEICCHPTNEQIKVGCQHYAFICDECQLICDAQELQARECARCENECSSRIW